ncbi:uncharacterized protein LOC122050423 [Zingiber officinale]|uniref:Avr9/Cf-9 rapidly elicited protein 146 n=1 Tax=Zingiber officinale TaxID=94328 RepID=A0A8J5LIN1_ZINOF|nr:uncharacterized protein LOC122050423 [Zingiber officinale]KAG6521086.1 hypothetical protein ZIOFF_018152 [Zingiber officinale]
MDPSVAKRICHMIRAVYFMIRKGLISKPKLTIHLHLLLRRGKLAGKALTNSLLLHRRRHHLSSADITSLSDLISFYDPGDVEFSCANTPSPAFSFLSAAKQLKSSRRGRQQDFALDVHLAAALAKELEVLGSASPVPAGWNQRSPAPPQLRVTDSPFPETEDEVEEEEEKDSDRVDREAEAFIRRFYEQLRLQQCAATATPDRV